MTNRIKLLAIDPGTREFGYAEFSGADLVDQNVKSLRRYNPPEDRVKVLARIITKIIDEKLPDAIALEKNGFSHTGPNALLMKSIAKIKSIAGRRRIPVYEIAPGTAKKIVTGDGWATKRQVAKALTILYPELKVYSRNRSHWRERYMQNMFDAVASGVAWLSLKADHKLKNHEVET